MPGTHTPEQQEAYNRVRRRVSALGFFAVAIHGVLGLIVVAHHVVDEPGRRGDAAALLVMSGVVAALTYTGVRLILGARWFHPLWLALAAVPTVVGFFWVL